MHQLKFWCKPRARTSGYGLHMLTLLIDNIKRPKHHLENHCKEWFLWSIIRRKKTCTNTFQNNLFLKFWTAYFRTTNQRIKLPSISPRKMTNTSNSENITSHFNFQIIFFSNKSNHIADHLILSWVWEQPRETQNTIKTQFQCKKHIILRFFKA